MRFKNESFIHHASLTLQWTPLLLVVSMFACENTHSVALGLQGHTVVGLRLFNIFAVLHVSCQLLVDQM